MPADTVNQPSPPPKVRSSRSRRGPFIFLLLLLGPSAADPCRIEVVDKENGWPVPLVELRSVHETRYVSDNAGLIALDDPELMGRDVWFHLKGHGYGLPKDGFGYEGFRTKPSPGGRIRVEVERRNVAKRLGRITGAGLFAEARKLGEKAQEEAPGIFGCDSVLMAPHNGKLFWLWGDTSLPGYPLGIFDSTAATTPLQPVKAFEPPFLMPFTHFRGDSGKPRGVVKIPGSGPTWLSAMASIDGRLVATYSKIENHLDEHEIGLCVWDDTTRHFLRERVLWTKGPDSKPPVPRGHPVRWTDPDGARWLLFGDPFPTLRCPDGFPAWKDPETWVLVDTPDAPLSAEDGSSVKPHRGSIVWNAFRKRWIAIFTQTFGKPSAFGEIWYSESDSPFGPWGPTVKILTHDNYTFYNPKIHAELTPEGAPFIVFEGTYTAEFANHAVPTPRYNYNQVLYRLDLDDPKLEPAQR